MAAMQTGDVTEGANSGRVSSRSVDMAIAGALAPAPDQGRAGAQDHQLPLGILVG